MRLCSTGPRPLKGSNPCEALQTRPGSQRSPPGLLRHCAKQPLSVVPEIAKAREDDKMTPECRERANDWMGVMTYILLLPHDIRIQYYLRQLHTIPPGTVQLNLTLARHLWHNASCMQYSTAFRYTCLELVAAVVLSIGSMA